MNRNKSLNRHTIHQWKSLRPLIADKKRGWQMMIWLDSITDSMDMNLSRLWETVKDSEALCVAIHGVTKNQTELSNWRTIVLEARHLSLRCQQNWFPLRAMRKNVPNVSSWLAIFFVSSLCAYFCLQISPSYKDISHIGWWHCFTLLLLLSHFSRVRLCATP